MYLPELLKAFDKVDHGIFLHKMKVIKIKGKIGRWIANFLHERKQEVLVKGNKFKESILKSGVPQGSVLGPLLFLIFIGDITQGVTAKTLVYVDDAKLKENVKNDEDVNNFRDNLDKVYTWAEKKNIYIQ